jgi:hypothetical protein
MPAALQPENRRPRKVWSPSNAKPVFLLVLHLPPFQGAAEEQWALVQAFSGLKIRDIVAGLIKLGPAQRRDVLWQALV